MRLIGSLFLFLLYGSFSYSQITNEWVVPLIEEQVLSFGVLPAVYNPKSVTDKFGFVYTTGHAGGGISYELFLGEEKLAAEGENIWKFYLSQVDAEGKPRWIKRFSGVRSPGYYFFDTPHILAQPNGGVVIVSRVRSKVMFGLDTIANLSSEWRHLMIAYIDTAGQMTSHHVVDAPIRELHAVAAADNGDLIITGQYTDFSTNLNNQVLSSQISPAYFAARISQTGEIIWANNIPTTFDQMLTGVTNLLVKKDGNILATISPASSASIIIGGTVEKRRPIVIYNIDGNSGQVIWHKEIASMNFGNVTDLAEFPNGDLYLVGRFGGLLRASNRVEAQSFDPTNQNITNGFLLKLTEDGVAYDLEISPDGFIGQQIIIPNDQFYILAGHISGCGFNSDGTEGMNYGIGLKVYNRSNELVDIIDLTDYDPNAFRCRDRLRVFLPDFHQVDASNFVLTGRYDGIFLGEGETPNIFRNNLVFISKFNINFDNYNDGSTTNQVATFTIFPNPSGDFINIQLQEGIFGDRAIYINNVIGQEVYRSPIIGERGAYLIRLDHLINGVYFLRIGENSQNLLRFIKQ